MTLLELATTLDLSGIINTTSAMPLLAGIATLIVLGAAYIAWPTKGAF